MDSLACVKSGRFVKKKKKCVFKNTWIRVDTNASTAVSPLSSPTTFLNRESIPQNVLGAGRGGWKETAVFAG